MEEILKAILGGLDQETTEGGRKRRRDGELIIDLLGDILGRNTAQESSAHPASPAPNPLGEILGDLIGGRGGTGGNNPIMDIIGAVLGGGNASGKASTNPIAQYLAEKLGLSPMIAEAIVAFFMAKLLARFAPNMMGTQPELGRPTAPPDSGRDEGLNLDHLLESADDEQALDMKLRASGMPQELADSANIDQETASRGLQELVKLVANRKQTPQPVTTQQSNLKGLLDNWETD